MLINLSNHPHQNWPQNQYNSAVDHYGSIIDMPFPSIEPDASLDQVRLLAEKYYGKIRKVSSKEIVTVHLMGESTFCFQLLLMLKDAGIPCVASTTKRVVEVNDKGQKVSSFVFYQFRHYF